MMENGQELIRGNEERIYVSVRLRPLNSKEISRNDVSDWECINDKTIVFKNVGILASERFMYQSSYTFDRVFRSDCSTREVYEQGAKNVAISVVSGINSSVFAYGQTSSGKTYTMTGITEYAIADIYDYMQKHPERDFILKFSALEIYNESVRDLLSEDNTQLRLLDDPERGTIVEKLTEEFVRDRDHVIQLLSICAAQRQIGETSLNETSSRSHQIIRLTIESSSREFLGKDNASTLSATVNFVDLAGSERASQSLSAGTRLKEGCHINRSLLTLGTVIRKLSKGRNGHIPYRDSKLTRILQTSLGGNARTAIICTMSPARTHVEQSRNTLLFASCAKEVTTNAQVNVVMSDKVLIKHLQKELARLESEIRNPGSTYVPPNYYAILREKNIQIEELEKEIKDLILQRDVALLQVNDLLRMLGNDASSTMQVGLRDYPHLRVQKSPDAIIQRHETSESPDPQSLTVDPRACSDRHNRTISDDFSSKAPSFDENFVNINATPRILFSSSSSSSSSSESCHGWAQIDALSITTSEDLCRDVRCVEPAEANNIQYIEANYLFYEPNVESNQELISSHLKNDNEVAKLDNLHEMMAMDEKQSKSPTFVKMEKDIFSEEKELISRVSNTEKESRSVDLSLRHHRDEDLFGNRNLKLVKSKSCQASITTDPDSPYLKMMEYSENTPAVGSEKEYSEGFVREIYPSNVGSSSIEPLSRNNTQSPPKNDLDLEINAPDVTCLNGEDGSSSSLHMSEKDDHPNDEELNENPVSQISESNESEKKNVDRVEDNEIRGLSSWPVEFKKLQREIIELWHACNIALVQRTYFFLHFQGDPTDAIYLEVEIRKMRFLKDKYSRGEKTVLNGKRLTLSSSAKILRQERRTLSEQMMKKFTEQERERLFVKWGISLKSKFRRLQLANLLWTNNEDMNHIEESAYLVAKLVGFIEPGQVPNKDMFGLNFAPQSSNTGISSYKRSLVSIF